MSGSIRVRRVADPTPVQRGPAPFPKYDDLTTAWNNHAEAKSVLRRTEARLEEAEFYSNAAHSPGSQDPRGKLSPSYRHYLTGMENLARVQVPVERVPSVEICSHKHQASNRYSHLNYGRDKVRKRVTIVDNLEGDQGSSHHLSPPRSKRDRLAEARNLDSLSPTRSVDSAQVQRLEHQLKSLSRTLKSSTLDRTHPTQASYDHHLMDKDWEGVPPRAESYDHRTSPKSNALSPSSQEILSRGSTNMSVDNSTAIRVLNDLLPRQQLEQGRNQKLRYQENYVPAYERLFGTLLGERSSERQETFTKEEESDALQRDATRLRAHESRKLALGGSASDHMERLREKVEQQKAAVANCKQMTGERTRHRDGDPVILQDPDTEGDSHLAGYPLPAGKSTVRKVATAPAAPAYKGFSEVETRFQMPDGKVVTEDQLTRKTSRKTSDKSTNRTTGKVASLEDRALKPSMALQQQNKPGQSSKSSRTVRKVHKGPPKILDKRPKRPDRNKDIISAAAWREGQKTVLKILGPPPEKPKMAAKQPAPHSPPTHDTEDPPSSKHQDLPLSVEDRTKDDFSDAELSEHPLERKEVGDNDRVPSPTPDLEKLPSEAKNVLEDLHLDPSTSEDEKPVSRDQKDGQKAPKIPKKKSARPPRPNPDPVFPAERVRHYDTDKVRRYMAKQKAERRRRLQEEKAARNLAQERKQEQLRELSKKQKDSVRLSQKNRSVANSQLGETFSKDPTEEVIGSQLNGLDQLPRHIPFRQDGKKIDVTSSDKENKNIWSTSSSDSSTQSSLPSDPPHSPLDQAPPTHSDPLGGIADSNGRTEVQPPPRPGSPIGVVVTQITGGVPDGGQRSAVPVDPGQRAEVMQPSIIGQAPPSTGISRAARSKADRIQALKATAAALQGKIDSEVKKLTGDFQPQAVTSPVDVNDRWAYPSGSRMATPIRSVHFGGSAVALPVGEADGPEAPTRYQRMVGSDRDHKVFTGSLPGTGILSAQARLAQDASNQEHAATRIQAAYRGHSVRQKLDWSRPSLGNAVQRQSPNTVPEVHVSKADQSSPLNNRGVYVSASLSEGSLSEGSLTDTAAEDKDYMPIFKSLPTTHGHQPPPGTSSDSPLTAVGLPTSPASRPISLPVQGADRWKESLADGLSVINIYTRKYQNANRVVLYGQLPTDSAKPKDSIIGYSCNDDFTGSPTTSSKSSRSKPEDDDPYSADFTADSSSKTKSKSKSKSTTSCSKSSYGTASNRKRSSRSGVTEQTPSRKADDNTLDLSPVESFGSSGDDVALHKGIPRTPSPKVLLSTHRPSTDRRTSPSLLTPNASLGSKSPSSPDSTLSSGSLPRSPATMEHQPGQRRSPLSGSKSPSGSGQSKPSLSSYSTDTRTRSSISTASSSAKGTENLFKPVNCVPSMEPGSDKGSERLLPQSARLHPSAAGRPPQPAQYSPAALSLKLASELNLLESLEESVRQLSDLERTRHISLAQQESVSLARVLQARQRDHEREIQLLSLKARQEVEEANKQLEVVRQRAVETASDAERVLAQARREAADAVSENARRLMETQAEAARVTAEAAKQMAEAQRMPAQPPPPSYDPGKLASDTATAATTAAVTAALEQQRLQQIEFLKEMKGPLAPPTPAVHTRSLGVVDRTALSGGQPSQASYSGTQASYTSHSNSSASGRSDSPHSPKQDYTDDFTDSAKSRRSPTNSVSTGTIPKASSLSPVSDHTRPRWPKSPNGSDSIRTASDVPSTQDGSSPSIPTESGFSPAKVDFSLSRRSNSSIKTASDVDAVSTVTSPSIAEDIPDKQHSSYYSSSGESRTKTSPSLTPSSASTPIRAKDEVRRPPHMVSDLTLDLDDSFTLSAEMLRQQLRDEEVRARQQAALFKLREKTLMEKAKVELEWLEHEKKRYKESGDTEKLQAARKRQQVLVTRVQQEQAEIRRLRAAQKAASHERQLLLYQQQEIARMRKATEAVRVQMRDLSNVSISSSLGGALSGSDQASVAASPSPTSPDLPEVLSDSSPDSPSVPNEEGEEKKLQPGVGPAYDKEGSVKGELTPAEKQAQVMLKLKKMQQPLSMKYLTKREQQLTKRRRNAEELLAWQRRLDEEEKQVVSMEREAMRRLDSSGGTAKSRPPMKALPPSHQALRDDSARDSDSASRITSEAVMDADSTRPHAREEGRREEDGRQASSGSVPEDISHDSSVPEEVNSDSSPKISTTRTASVPSNDDTLKHSDSILEEYTSESFESADRTLTPARSSPAPPPPAAAATIPLRSSQHSTPPSSLDSFRAPLSPHRRILESESGSESEKSFSQTVSEIASDQSDIEGRVKALESELRKRKMEADKLRRQQKRMQREKLKAQEASLKKQLEAYDKLIEKTKAELKNESEAAGAKSASSMAVKPQIKQLRLTEAQRLKDRSHTRSLRQRTASESSSGRDGRAELGGAMHKQRSVSEGSMSSRSSLDEEAGLGRDHSYSSVGSVFTPPTTPRLAEDTTPPPPKSPSPSPSTKRDKSSISASISEEVFERTSSSTSDEDSQRVVTASRKSQSPDELSHRRGGPQHLEECEEQRDSSALSEVSEDVPSAYSSVSATPEISLKESPRSDVETDVQKASLSVKAREEYQEVKDQRSEQSEASTVPEEVFSAGSSLSQDSIRSVSKKIVLDERKYSPKTEPAENVETLEKKSPALVAGRSADDLSQKSEKSYSLSSSVRSSHRSRTQSEQSGASYSEDFVESSISIGVKNKESYLEDTDDDISEQLSIASEPSEPSFASSGKPSFILSPGKLSLEAAKNDLEVAPEVTVSERGSSEEQEKLEAVSEDDERTPVPSPQEEQLETSQDFTGYQIGDRVMVGSKEQGTLLFKGMTHFAPGWWGGVELDDQKGTNDGSLDGHVYFQCKPSHGMFVPADRLEHLAPEPEREETEPEQDSPVEEDLPSVASEGSNISQRKILQGLKDKENDKPEYSLLSSLSSKTPSEPIKPLAQVLKSEATDDDSVVEDLSEPMTDDAALAALISTAAAAVESFHEDDINHIFPQSADAQTPRGAPEQEASPSRSKEQLVDSITDHLTAIVMKDSVKAIAEVAERHTLQNDGRKEISEAKGALRSTSTEKPSGSLLGMLVQDDAIKSTRDVMQDKGERQDKVDEKANQKVAIKRKIDSTTQTLLTEAITEIMTLRNKRAKQKESEGNLRTTSLPESPKSPSPETPCPSPFVRVATPYTPDSESPIPQEDATLDDDIFINRVKVETNNLDLKDQDQFPVARPGSPVFGESSGFNPEALSEKLEQMQQLNADIFEGDLFGEQEWFDDDFGSMPKSKSIIQVPVRSQEVSVRSLPPSPSTPEPSRLDLTRIAQEPFYAIPHNRRDVKSLVGRSVQVVHEKAVLGERTASLFPPAEIMGEDIQGSDIESTSRRSYKRLIFDLVGEAYQDITSEQEQGEQLPWTKTKRRPRKYFFDRPPRELPDLAQVVEDRALFVTGLAGRPKPDPALARFGGKKKKDHVDEILTLELREEEQEWVNYDDDELAVKMQLTEAIFDSLLTDTAMALNRIQDRRRARMTPQEPEIEF